jgi:hypothetical protein
MDYKKAQKNMRAIRKAMGLRGAGEPGDITMKAKEIFNATEKRTQKVLGAPNTKRGLAKRGLI